MEETSFRLRHALTYVAVFGKWLALAGVTGLLAGLVGSAFHISVGFAESLRLAHGFLLYLLPVAGLVIVAVYRLTRMDGTRGTNQILEAVRDSQPVPALMGPAIFLGTVLTHLCGGSAGREGAALQLGGCIGSATSRLLHLRKEDWPVLTLCGMAGLFSALFGTPVTAVFFVLEVVSVGAMHYGALVPCAIASLCAFGVSRLFAITPVRFALTALPSLSLVSCLQVAALGAACALVSILFCSALHGGERLFHRLLPNPYIRIAAGGLLVIALTVLVGTRDYNGAGMDVVARAMGGQAVPRAFILKILFTVITISAGFRGGEIVPTFFVGSTLGCALAPLLGLDAGFGAAVGLCALFCGMVNCPVTAILLAMELFSPGQPVLFVIACAVSYMLSGRFGLYESQKLVFSKLHLHRLDRFVSNAPKGRD